MDQNRQIRFLIPPFFLLASLFWADFLSGSNIFSKIAVDPGKNILAIVASLGSTIPLGFLIGGISIALLNLFGFVVSKIKKEKWNYESGILEEACKKIWPQLELESNFKFDFEKRFYISATFDHDILPEGINKWVMRRWNAFNINFNCYTALILSYAALLFLPIDITLAWVSTTILLMALLLVNATAAWLQTMEMIEFQANRNLNKKEGFSVNRRIQMLYCGAQMNRWVEIALNYLPDEIFDKINGKIAITVLKSDAARLAQEICNQEEIILLSPWIFSYMPAGSCETDKECRYFIFCVLHEVAHVVLKHYPPDQLSGTENKGQEDVADRYALKWFNKYAFEYRDNGLTPIAIEEIKETQEKYQKKLEPILSCG